MDLARLKARKLGILVDDSQLPERAILVAPASLVDRDLVAEILNLTGGLLSVAMTPPRVDAFLLTEMARPRLKSTRSPIIETPLQFCISVEAREGVTTGISADDRAHTIRILGEDLPSPRKIVSPGHIFPVQVRTGGVLVRTALPEGAVDLVVAAGFTDAALMVEVLDRDGNFMSEAGIGDLAQQKNLPLFKLSNLVRHRLQREKLVTRIAEAKLPTRHAGELSTFIYKSSLHEGEHVALTKGTFDGLTPVLTRVQLENTFGDIFGGQEVSSRTQIHLAMKAIGENGSGVLLYLRRPYQGQLAGQAYSFLDRPRPATMMREYGLGAQILRDLGVRKLELLTDSKNKFVGLDTFGLEIVSQRQLVKSVS